jgi:hypothetical protein
MQISAYRHNRKMAEAARFRQRVDAYFRGLEDEDLRDEALGVLGLPPEPSTKDRPKFVGPTSMNASVWIALESGNVVGCNPDMRALKLAVGYGRPLGFFRGRAPSPPS